MKKTIEDFIGNTPLVRLQRLPGAENAKHKNVILAKLEGNNPAGSVKDRPAISMIRHAEDPDAARTERVHRDHPLSRASRSSSQAGSKPCRTSRPSNRVSGWTSSSARPSEARERYRRVMSGRPSASSRFKTC